VGGGCPAGELRKNTKRENEEGSLQDGAWPPPRENRGNRDSVYLGSPHWRIIYRGVIQRKGEGGWSPAIGTKASITPSGETRAYAKAGDRESLARKTTSREQNVVLFRGGGAVGLDTKKEEG